MPEGSTQVVGHSVAATESAARLASSVPFARQAFHFGELVMPGPKRGASARTAAVEKILTTAAKSGNIEAAIKKHGKSLSVADANVLRSLSSADLKSISKLRPKLGPLGTAVDDNNGFIF